MFKLEEFRQLVKDFASVADFLVVYIAEAHSTGQWDAAPRLCWGLCALKEEEGIIDTIATLKKKKKKKYIEKKSRSLLGVNYKFTLVD